MAARRGAKPQRRSRANQDAQQNPMAIEDPDVEIDIEDLSEFNESKNIIVYGPSGHGKTTLVGGTQRATFLSTESGVISAKRTGSKAALMRARSWAHCVAGIKRAERELGPNDWLIVDSITKMQRLQIRGILENQNAMKGDRDLDVPALQDHQKWQNQFIRFFDRIMDGPFNSIVVAQSMIRTDHEGEDQVLPALVGGDRWVDISHYMCAQADVVLYYALAKNEDKNAPMVRRALAQPYPPWFAKDRYDALGRWQDVADGDYTAMAEFIEMLETPPE